MLALINLIFALLAWRLAWSALRRGVDFVRVGWLAIDTAVQHPGYRSDFFARGVISEGGRFLVAGIAWVLLAVGAGGAGAAFAAAALRWSGV